jgi:hypothetical protein
LQQANLLQKIPINLLNQEKTKSNLDLLCLHASFQVFALFWIFICIKKIVIIFKKKIFTHLLPGAAHASKTR